MPHRWSRRHLVQGAGAMGLGLLAGCGRWPGAAPAQPKGYRLGWLTAAGGAPSQELRQALHDLGYVADQNVVIEYRSADGHDERLPALAAELVTLPVDILLVVGDPATQAAQQATRTIPIVMAPTGNPVATGLVASLARPGGNTTGVTNASPQLTAKRLEILQDVRPGLARVGVLWRVGNTGTELGWREVEDAARRLGMELISLALRGPDDFDSAFAIAQQDRAEALFPLMDQLIQAHRQRILDFAVQSGLVGMYSSRAFVQDGGLMAYTASTADWSRRAAAQVDKLLKGANPADLPIEEPMRFDFLINLKTAAALGLTIPHHVLLQATEVIQ
jgi:putative tryptophan/tyrosine transport system substrate-binding protein